jgi:hypothetical protein
MPVVVTPVTVPLKVDIAATLFVVWTFVLLLLRKSLTFMSLSRIAVAPSVASALPVPL